MVYSTCSFNPLENEAVVMELLRRSNGKRDREELKKEKKMLKTNFLSGSVSLVDVSERCKNLLTCNGRGTWQVNIARILRFPSLSFLLFFFFLFFLCFLFFPFGG